MTLFQTVLLFSSLPINTQLVYEIYLKKKLIYIFKQLSRQLETGKEKLNSQKYVFCNAQGPVYICTVSAAGTWPYFDPSGHQ